MGAYYNEIDPFKAAELRELIRVNLIAPGEVDERSIEDVEAADLKGFTQCHFFAGIGVWSYALRLAGWSDSRPVWTGSCPCPSFSAAGKGEGFEDARHLWPYWFKLIRECRPSAIFGEQVESAIGFGWLDLVQTDLEAEAYAVGKAVLGACSVGAPHRRQRLYFVADTERERGNGRAIGKEIERCAPQGEREEEGRRFVQVRHNGDAFSGSDSDGRRSQIGWSESRSEDRYIGNDDLRSETPELRASRNGSHPDGRNASAEGLQRSGEYGLRAEDGCCSGIERDDQRAEVGDSSNSMQRRFRMRGSTSGSNRRVVFTSESRDGNDPDSAGSFSREQAGATAGHGSSAESASGALDGLNSFQSRLEGHFGDVREWRGSGWLDPIAARSVAKAGATRGFWADCDWWYGRDGKYRPIGAGLFPLVNGAPARVGRLRGYGDAIVAQVAQAFIEACIGEGK